MVCKQEAVASTVVTDTEFKLALFLEWKTQSFPQLKLKKKLSETGPRFLSNFFVYVKW